MKPSIPKGTRDFLPKEVYKRQYIFDTIKSVFEVYGYQPIETPVMEKLSTLTGKYGDEGDQLLFKILNNGDFLAKADKQALSENNSKQLVSSISKKGLRYDLTVPFARFVTMYQNDISFPFKRYQIQQVWRGDRPQKGRYQEFYQCDVDVVGSDSLMYEAELVKIYDDVFHKLGIASTIKVNNRKVLFGIAEAAGIADKFMEMTIAIDKLDKIGEEGVINEMAKKDIDSTASHKVLELLKIDNLKDLEVAFTDSPEGLKGVAELKQFHVYLDTMEAYNKIKFDISLARGLSYYTGCIFEVVSNDVNIGSIGGGGRYDDLTSSFGMKGVSGVGVSFGAARIYDVMEELDLFPKSVDQKLQYLFVSFDEESHTYAFSELSKLRKAGISADLYPEPTKLKKQMKYANDIAVPHVVLIGSDEVKSGKLTVKNMQTGDQSVMTLDEIISKA
ncbi:histidine--tRNA ligase [Saprospiraceae bacterium]|nr:histidine--tRNA ligase [Saprospiraceae bacterium]